MGAIQERTRRLSMGLNFGGGNSPLKKRYVIVTRCDKLNERNKKRKEKRDCQYFHYFLEIKYFTSSLPPPKILTPFSI